MAALRQKMEKFQPDRNIPGSVSRKRDPFFGGVENRVVCADRKAHEYLNAGVPEEAMPSPVYSACPKCGHAVAGLIGTVGIKCNDCQWEEFMVHVTELESEEQVQLLPRHEDPASLRARYGYHDRPIRVCPVRWGEAIT